MNEYMTIISDALDGSFEDIIISNPRKKTGPKKVQVRPVVVRGTACFQLTRFEGTQVFHENLQRDEVLKTLEMMLTSDFRQALIRTADRETQMLISKKGKATVKSHGKAAGTEKASGSHNREKQYILQEGVYVPFLKDLGVMTSDGVIVRQRYDKFRQINRYLEFVRDILPALDTDRRLTIIDFGCGKSYLTFAVYYYLKVLCGRDIRMIGLDLKADVIKKCNALAEAYGYDSLHFLCGDIADFEGENQVDMVMTLHACDTATDYALAKAFRWNARVILSVPCCQHELNRKMDCQPLQGALRYGIIRERTAALMTDAMRAQLLEIHGYQTQLLEFIDMAHTPKNILIRAVRQQKMTPAPVRKRREAEYQQCRALLGAAPLLEKLLSDEVEEDDHA